MNWEKKDTCQTVEEVVLRNTKMSKEEFESQMKSHTIKGMDIAANMIWEAISNNMPITVVGDYDADGVCSSAILKLMFNHLGVPVRIRLPHRFSEGYGLSEKIVDEIDSGLLITVDNGIAAVDAIRKAKEKELKIIILDHHLLRDDGLLPDADLVIDPSAIPGTCDFTKYCGGGLAYKLACEIVDDPVVLSKISCFAAIATVADVMPLIGENKKIVIEGMKNLTKFKTRTTGLSAMMYAKNLDHYITAKDIGFSIGPMINAAGRLLDNGAEVALDIVTFDGDLKTAKEKAAILNELNERRKEMVRVEMERANEEIENSCLFSDNPLVLYLPGTGEGIIGILAGKIAEKYSVPCFVFTDTEGPFVKGSGRNPSGDIHLKNLLDKISAKMKEDPRTPDGIVRYGGHQGAAALTLPKDYFPVFYDASQECCPDLPEKKSSALYYDLEIEASQIPDMFQLIEKYGPFGEGNPEVVFKIKNFELVPKYFGLYTTNGTQKENISFASRQCTARGYGLADKFFSDGTPANMDLVGMIQLNTYKEASIGVEVLDLQKVEVPKAETLLAKLLAEKAKARSAV